MGIVYQLIRATPEAVMALSGRPRAVAEFVYGDPDLYEASKPGFFKRIFGGQRESGAPIPERRADDEIDLDKSWHIVHFLLTGSTGRGDGPLRLIADDLHPLADLDLGLGRPNVISVAEVSAFAAEADALTDAEFLARYVPGEIPTDELYLGQVIARGDHDDIREYSLENFRALRAFARQAANNGEALITYYT